MLEILRGRGVSGANGGKVGLGSIRRPVIGLALGGLEQTDALIEADARGCQTSALGKFSNFHDSDTLGKYTV